MPQSYILILGKQSRIFEKGLLLMVVFCFFMDFAKQPGTSFYPVNKKEFLFCRFNPLLYLCNHHIIL